MSDNTDIAARTQRFREAVRSFTPPPPKRYARLTPMKDGVVELRNKGASLRLIRELLLAIDVSVSIETIARFLAEMDGAKSTSRRVRQSRATRSAVRQSHDGKSATQRTRYQIVIRSGTDWFVVANRSTIRATAHARSARGPSAQSVSQRTFL